MIIGVDLDNTIVAYDALFEELAVQRGLIEPRDMRGKKNLRDTVRRLPDGEIEWQKLQGAAYGPLMARATLIDGVREFFQACHARQIPLYVVSHKTEYANYDPTRTNLRLAALDWMRQNDLLAPRGALAPENVHFETTRREKLARIRALRCTHFVDDLEETFLEADFPVGVEKILYAPRTLTTTMPGVRLMQSWQAIGEHLFAARS